ncbi:RHS repeat domain-containing protein [Erwinia piriflorinigrans]|uniref:(Nematicidal protein 2)-like protein n=1 Tax=Erwinia piriflorinigrans CFBP 5888 TaxID=1161919 RepID=V5Z6U9_9GAMM|nr:RHS repeat domain-containing protein [Erwinia piriflorinigrans]CCG86657.1 (nematicidal protein 2)-like protein [Erwinia piriflorinigrans CFBP 5888]
MGIIENPLEKINVNTQQDNFISACMSGVDPRNGVFNHATTILDYRSVISDVSFSFVLNYNSKYIYNNQGYGYGFTDNLSRYDKERRVLTLSSGQVYSIASDNADEQPSLVDYNFENFTFTKEKIQSLHGTIYRYFIKYIDGNVEKLENRDLRGVEQNCYVPTAIYFGMNSEIIMQWDYLNGVPYLQTVIEKKTDIFSNKYLLAFTRIDRNYRRIRVFEDEFYGYDVFLKNNKKNLLVQIKNYGFDISGKYNWDFKYSNREGRGRLLNEIRYPCGRKDKVEYLRASDGFNLSLPKKMRLYRVRRYYITPQFIAGIKKIVTQYTFSSVGEDKTYSSVEEYMDIRFRVIKKISRTYNKFHLLMNETTEVGLSTTEVIYTYEACDENKELAQQPINYQCINEIKTALTDLAIAKNNKRCEVILMSYDEKGNLIRQVNNNGVIIFFSYTDKINHAGVSVNIPNGVRLIKSIEIMYLKDIGSNLVKEYDYELIINAVNSLAKNGGNSTYKLLPMNEKTLINNILVKSTSFEYFKGIHDRISAGRLKSSSIKCFDRLTVKRFYWSGEDYKSEMTLNIKTEVQGVIIDEVLVWSAVTGLVKRIVDSLYRKYEYTRDKIGRINIAKITSNIHDEVRSKTFQYNYEYKVDDISGILYYEKKTIDFHKDKIHERYDGLGRLQCVAMSKSDSDEEKILHAYKYDELSRLDYEEHFSYKDDERFSYISLYSYDDWGYIKTIKHNDGVEENIVTDLINRTKAHWLECDKKITNETLISFDINNEPVSYRRYYSNGELLQITLERDFCGRLVKYHDELGNVTEYGYDLFDRVNKITFPDNSVINRDYSKYSEEPLIEKITFKSSDGKSYNIGTQTFDHLNRLVESQSYGVITKYVYSLHYPLPEKVFFADGTVHIHNNDYSLKNNILSVVDDQKKFFKTFKYSAVDDSLIESKFLTPRDIFIEKINEDKKNSCLEINTKFIHDGRAIDLTYRQEDYYNNEGIYKITDETNTEYLYSRDSYGRITEVRSDKIRTEVLYDIFSRIFQVNEYDGNGKTVIQYAYDEFSREISRKFYLFFDSVNTNKQPDLIIAVNTRFYKNNLIKSRAIEQYHEDTKTDIRKEVFAYDVMNRIIFYKCEGSSLIKGKNKKGIKSIGYSYDEVGNVSITDTVYEDDSLARMNFYYEEK